MSTDSIASGEISAISCATSLYLLYCSADKPIFLPFLSTPLDNVLYSSSKDSNATLLSL